ncbi:MAG: hypothetical protein LW878_06905 [Proteobacteria bacterium]|nr:hypothetical protein [Pseudomonadota bacterium]
MKLLLIILLICSCGKKNKYAVDSLNLFYPNSDMDGDGVTDMKEVSQGRNHLIADINTNNSIVDDNFVLIDGALNEFEIKIKPKRIIRIELLRKVLGLDTGVISDTNKLTVDFNSSEDFWKFYHSGRNFYHYYFKANKNQSYPLPVDFEEKRSLELNNFSDYGILDQVKQSTYRLIISTPQKEVIYYLHPSISLIRFLETEHGAHFSQGVLTKLDSDESSNQLTGKRWDYVTDALETMQEPRAGRTYAFIFADISDYQRADILDGRKSWDLKHKSTFDHRLEKTIFIPSFYKREIQVSKTQHAVQVGEHLFNCFITEQLDQGLRPYTATAEQILDWLKPFFLEDIKLHWSYFSSRGITVRVSGNISKYRNLALLNSKVSDATIGIGVTESNCNFSRPHVVPHSLYTGHKEYYFAD